MRLVKSCALNVIDTENGRIREQRARCRAQAAKLSSAGLGGMEGAAVAALRQRIRMHAAVVRAHLTFYDSLLAANVNNHRLIEMLPETDPGVLDSEVARARKEEAQANIRAIEARRDEMVMQAEQINASVRNSVWYVPSAGMEAGLIDIPGIRNHYGALIAAQESVVRASEAAVRAAAEYESQSQSLYAQVECALIEQAAASAESFVSAGTWGNCTWVASLATASFRYLGKPQVHRPSAGRRSLLGAALAGFKADSAVRSYECDIQTDVGGMDARVHLGASALHTGMSLKPYGSSSRKPDKPDSASSSMGGRGKADFDFAAADASADLGLFHADGGMGIVSGAVSGTLGAAFVHEGAVAPGVEASLKAEGSLLNTHASGRVGTSDTNVHMGGEGNVVTASAEARTYAGVAGVGGKVEAEAYIATGTVSGGLSFAGVRVDVGVDAKVGGLGANAGVALAPSGAEGELGLGLGVGLGLKVRVDWSGALSSLADAADTLDAWWDSLESRCRKAA